MDPRERWEDPLEALRVLLDAMQSGLFIAEPGIIQSFDPAKLTCTVQPAIKAQRTNQDGSKTIINKPVLADVPVKFPCGGGFNLTFPLVKGDEVLLIFAHRAIDIWWQQGGVQPPAEHRFNDASDAIAIAGLRSLPRALSGGTSTVSCQLRSDDGETVIDVQPGRIQVNADEVNLHARKKITLDVNGMGFVYSWNGSTYEIDTYQNGVTGTANAPTPPEVPT